MKPVSNFPIFYPNKFLGQNFLIDKNVLQKIVAAAELKPTDTVVEIGAGTGVLTIELAKRAGRVVAFEIDKKLVLILKDKLKEYKNVDIINEDVLNFELRTLNSELILKFQSSEFGVQSSEFKIVANIPYNITSAVLEKFLSAKHKPSLMVLLVQKEVAERVCAQPGEMSVLSVMVQYYGQPKIIARVPVSAFWPRPKVESAVLKIKLNIPLLGKSLPRTCCGEGLGEVDNLSTPPVLPFPRGGKEEKLFFQIVKAGFSRRRKMLKNSLNTLNFKIVKNQQLNNLTIKQSQSGNRRLDETKIIEILKAVGLPSTVRAQELGVEDWEKITSCLFI